MKSVSFLRNTWRRKDNKSPAKALPPVEPTLSSKPVLKLDETEPLPLLQLESVFENTYTALPNEPDKRALMSPLLTPVHRGKHGAPFNSTHGPPHNPFHGPPSLNVQHSDATASNNLSSHRTPPHRPPRPPSLELFSTPNLQEAAVPRSPTRVKFAPGPQIRPPRPDSPLRPVFSPLSLGAQNLPARNGVRAASIPSDDIPSARRPGSSSSYPVRDINHYYGTEDYRSAEVTIVAHASAPHLQERPRTADVVLNRGFYRTMNSTPNLSLPSNSDQSNSETTNGDLSHLNSSSDFSVFPLPPPLLIRKRPKPLVLLPTPTLARLPPSPSFNSNDSTPLATPISPRPFNIPRSHSTNFAIKSVGRHPHTRSPPIYSPPNSPLPSPPIFPDTSKPSDRNTPPDKLLRTARSTFEFRDKDSETLQAVHRSTSSAPAYESLPCSNVTQKCASSRSGAPTSISHPSMLPADTNIHWGYAV